MDPSTQFVVPTIIDVPELIVTNEDADFEDGTGSASGAWLNKFQFLGATSSYTIGLGQVWRFSHLCYKHGGGAFLAAYTTMLITVGLPLFLMELAFGQYANEGPITIWRISPVFEGIGYSMCLISAMIAIYYNILNTWIIHYLLASLTFHDLPWTKCDNSWNTVQCFLRPDTPVITANCTMSSDSNSTTSNPNQNQTSPAKNNEDLLFAGNCSSKINSYEFERIINSTDDVTLPSNEYFHNNVLTITNSLEEVGAFNRDLFFALVIAWATVFVVILRSLRLTGNLTILTFILPYMALTALFVRALSLPGFEDGISFYMKPQWERLQNIDIWADATTQIFFSLSPCWGGIITLASMNKFHNNFHADAILLVTINYATSLYSGLVAFSILGYMAKYSGVAISEVVDVGIGFVFMVYTEALAKLPLANLNSIMFFTILLYIGFTSQITVMETVMTTIIDTWPHKLRYRKPLILMVLCALMFFISITMCFGNGFYVVQLLDNFAGTFIAMTIGLLELIAIAWVYGIENFMQDIDDMISVHRNLFPSRTYWYFLWRYLAPSMLFAILLFCVIDLPPLSYRNTVQPEWSIKIGWILTACCLSVIPAVAVVRFLLSPSGSFLDKLSYLCRPSEDWAPSSYVSGPKLLNRHLMDDREFESSHPIHYNHQAVRPYTDQDQDSNESNEDLKVVNGRANYIIPEEEDDTDTGLITNETNV